jgi:ferritin-like metal-binding protein YciE
MKELRHPLIRALQDLHAGEIAAARAYRGHSIRVRDPDVRRRIRAIEDEEWAHREDLSRMLAALGASPNPLRERLKGLLGSVLQVLCARFPEWLLAAVAAWLEHKGATEYRNAALLAQSAGESGMAQTLLDHADVEEAHGVYFDHLKRLR